MTAISISDANLEAVKNMCRELSLERKTDINQREMEDKICEYVLARKEAFINTMFGSSENKSEEAKSGGRSGERSGK